MGGQQDGLTPGAHFTYQVPDSMVGLRIKTRGQLIEKDQLRVGEQSQGDEETNKLQLHNTAKGLKNQALKRVLMG